MCEVPRRRSAVITLYLIICGLCVLTCRPHWLILSLTKLCSRWPCTGSMQCTCQMVTCAVGLDSGIKFTDLKRFQTNGSNEVEKCMQRLSSFTSINIWLPHNYETKATWHLKGRQCWFSPFCTIHLPHAVDHRSVSIRIIRTSLNLKSSFDQIKRVHQADLDESYSCIKIL